MKETTSILPIPPQPVDLLQGIQATLLRLPEPIDYERIIGEFGQVDSSKRRQEGKAFGFREHLRGLVLSLLSNQRRWGLIAPHLKAIDTHFSATTQIVSLTPNHIH